MSRHRARVQWVDRLTILMLIYTCFADSVAQGIWSHHGLAALLQTLLGTLLLFEKTLAAGVPMAHLILAGNPATGLMLMPLMLDHPLQLAISGVLAQH